MKVKTIVDTPVLIPNQTHKNFTRTAEIIPSGTELEGTPKIIKGMKRGEPFNYKLFYTNDNKIIYIKNTDMTPTEVTLGADAAKSGIIIKEPNTSNLGARPVIGALLGAGAGFAYCKYKKHDGKKTTMYVAVGAVVGFIAGKYLQSKLPVKVKNTDAKIIPGGKAI